MKIFRNKKTDIYVRLGYESDGYYGDFGPEYWQIESPEKWWNYIGTSPFEMNIDKIEKSSDWEEIRR